MSSEVLRSAHSIGEQVEMYYVNSETLISSTSVNALGVEDEVSPLLLPETVVHSGMYLHPLSSGLTALRRTPFHRRSFTLVSDNAMPDERGVTTIKGCDWSSPGFYGGIFDPFDLDYRGGMLREDAFYAHKRGEELNDLGIYGERIVRIDRLNQLPHASKLVDLEVALKGLACEYQGDLLIERIKKLTSEDDLAPVVVFRQAPTDIRLSDLRYAVTREYFDAYIAHGMARAGKINDEFSGLNFAIDDDLMKFLTFTLPYLYAKQMGRLSNEGLTQEYPHAGNILIDGGLVDLDGIIRDEEQAMQLHGMYIAGLELGVANAITKLREIDPDCKEAKYPSRFDIIFENIWDSYGQGLSEV